MKYTKSSSLNGSPEPEEIVNEVWVERFISDATLEWFRELGGQEKVTKHRNGTIVVTSTSPDGENRRVTVFKPLKEES